VPPDVVGSPAVASALGDLVAASAVLHGTLFVAAFLRPAQPAADRADDHRGAIRRADWCCAADSRCWGQVSAR
jgi:hypothetical protein